MEWTEKHFTVAMVNMWLQISKLKQIKHVALILHAYHVTLQRLFKNNYLSLDFLRVLIREVRFSTFSFITIALLDVLDKKDTKITHLCLHILAFTPEVDDPEKCLTYDTLANTRLSQGNPSSKLFWLKFFWVDDIQFPAHHKKSAKTNKNQLIVTKKLILNSKP